MTSSVVRLNSGDVIQLRTGVLQGIGPAGPTGAIGPPGSTGPVGPQGVPGPQGLIADYYTKATSVGNSQSVAPTTETMHSFNTVVHDDASLVGSISNFLLPIGLWYVQASMTFQKPGGASATGYRLVSLYYDGVAFELAAQNSIPVIDTMFQARTLIDATAAGRILNVKVTHSDVTALAVFGTIVITRIGPGAAGPSGVAGPPGPPGVVGPAGAIGPTGTLVGSSTTIAAIGG